MPKPIAALCGAFLLACAADAHAIALRCEIASKFTCEPTGCRPQDSRVWNMIDFDTSRYSRCDALGCDHYEMLVARSGIFWNIEAPARSLFAKVSDDGATFLEVAALQTFVQVSYGSCRRHKQPD
jgi:hypothetical protein